MRLIFINVTTQKSVIKVALSLRRHFDALHIVALSLQSILQC